MPTILHAADLHLGAPYAFLPEDKAEACREAQMQALEQMVFRARTADAVLLSGDVFDSPSVPISIAKRAFSLLSRTGCPVLISPGNHDYFHANSVYQSAFVPENIHVFTENLLSPYRLRDDTVIWGAAFHDRSASIPLAAALDADKLNLLLVHSDLGGTGGYNPLDEAALSESGFDYAAFGHNHVFSGINRANNTIYACPGCLMGTGFDDAGAKGYLLGTVEKGLVSLQFEPANGIRFDTLELSLNGLASDRDLSKCIRAALPEAPETLCLQFRLTGEASYVPDLDGLTNALRQVLFFAEVNDVSREARDLWAALDEDTLKGAVTRRFRAMLCEPQADEELLRMALSCALAALSGEQLPR